VEQHSTLTYRFGDNHFCSRSRFPTSVSYAEALKGESIIIVLLQTAQVEIKDFESEYIDISPDGVAIIVGILGERSIQHPGSLR
jgi:hypothetical protein